MVTVEHADGLTWRPPIPFRIVNTVSLAPFSAVIGFLAWVTLPTGRLPGWWFLVLAVPLWLWLVYRAWTLSATLAPDALIARGLLSSKRIPLTDITAVGFLSHSRDWAPLIVTVQRRRHVILAVMRNEETRPDRRVQADEAAAAIRAAAAL
jgi:hypothetical protein